MSTAAPIPTGPQQSAPARTGGLQDCIRSGRLLSVVLAAPLLALTVGNTTVAVAAWLAPVLMLRFVRGPGLWRLPAGAVVMAAAHVFGWRGVLPFEGGLYLAVTTAAAVALFTPYVADKLLATRLQGFPRSLVFPAAWVTVEFIYSRLGFGSWGLIAYSQYGELPLLQLLSVTGMLGLTFLIGWFAAIANSAWETGWRGRKACLQPLVYGVVILAVGLGGGMRLAFGGSPDETVRIAGITVDNLEAFHGTWGPLTYGRPLTPELAAASATKVGDLQAALLIETANQARAGARIIVWSEGNALVFKADEDTFIARAQAVAAEHRVYLFAAMAVMTPGERLVENKVIAIDPAGKVRTTYLKSYPTPGEMSVPGDRQMRVLDTPHGRIALAICYDFDYSELIRQAGRAGADILIDPSWDNRGMTPMHSHMAVFRAIENGASLFRPANGGLGLAVDHRGRVLASLDHHAAAAGPRILLTDLPTRGVGTWYPWLGDILALVSFLLLICLGALAIRRPAMTPALRDQ